MLVLAEAARIHVLGFGAETATVSLSIVGDGPAGKGEFVQAFILTVGSVRRNEFLVSGALQPEAWCAVEDVQPTGTFGL